MARATNGQRRRIISEPTKSPPERWQTGDKVKSAPLRWVLPGRIILGSICILEGDTSAGKSVFLAALAGSITSGKEWLGRSKTIPGNIIWFSSEEDYGRDIMPRVNAAGGIVERIHVPAQDETGIPRHFSLPSGLSELRTAVSLLNACVVIIEPLTSFMDSGVDLNSTMSVRAALDPIQRAALSDGWTCIMTRGLRKNRTGPKTSHGEGSNTIGATARSVLRIDAVNPLQPPRLLSTVKCFKSKHTPVLSYNITASNGHGVMTDLVELGQDDDRQMGVDAEPGERCVIADARALLRNMLKEEPVRATIIRAAAEDGMISVNTLRRAQEQLGVRSFQKYEGGVNVHYWKAPDGGFPPDPPGAP